MKAFLSENLVTLHTHKMHEMCNTTARVLARGAAAAADDDDYDACCD